MYVDRRVRTAGAPPEALFREIARIGGDAGWPNARILWEIRGAMDRVVGGAGMRRGRRDPEVLVPGDVLDCWRVEACEPPERLRLLAEMKLPGRGWLEWEVTRAGEGRSRLVQTATFDSSGALGKVYWLGSMPFHEILFEGMVRALCRQAEQRMLAQEPVAPPSRS